MPEKNQLKYHFTSAKDLSDQQIEETVRTYLMYAERYVKSIERVSDAHERIQALTLIPFIKEYKKAHHHLPVLFLGAGSGRDMQTTENLGIPSIGIDISPEMQRLAKDYGVNSPYYVMDMRDLTFPNRSLGGIFCETAISHIKKGDALKVLQRCYNLLCSKGIMMLGIRTGDGRVFYADEEEVGGRRYNTTFTADEAEQMIKLAGFNILASPKYEVKDRPAMIDYMLQK